MLQSATVELEHRQNRVDLACAFRWVARLGMHESIANHFSFAVSDDGTKFLINPGGRHFSRIKASDLLLVDANDAHAINQPDAPDITAWALHSEIHKRNPGARCVLHVQWQEDYPNFADQHLAALRTILDEEDPSYAQ